MVIRLVIGNLFAILNKNIMESDRIVNAVLNELILILLVKRTVITFSVLIKTHNFSALTVRLENFTVSYCHCPCCTCWLTVNSHQCANFFGDILLLAPRRSENLRGNGILKRCRCTGYNSDIANRLICYALLIINCTILLLYKILCNF